MAIAADVDPVTFEIIRHKLYSVMDETIIALENVSGSPITNEGHDLMASLYKADGGLMVGGVAPSARDNYQEGFQSKGLKIVERGRVRRDVLDTFLNMVRDPGMTQLDLKSQLAANHVAKQRMKELYADYGVDVVE